MTPATSPAGLQPNAAAPSKQRLFAVLLAAGLGWMFDGLEMHLYTLVAAPFVMQLLATTDAANPKIKEKSAYIQAAFLVGWALGVAFFGRLGDLLGGRSRTLALTILSFARFPGISHGWGRARST